MATKAEIEKLELDNALLRQENDDIRRKLRSDVNALEALTKLAKVEQDLSASVKMFNAIETELEAHIENLEFDNDDLWEDIGDFRKDVKLKDIEIDRLNGLLKLGRAEQGKIWLDAWLSVASSSNCLNKHSASVWADSALEEYNKRFGR